jgi:hypothetical protein
MHLTSLPYSLVLCPPHPCYFCPFFLNQHHYGLFQGLTGLVSCWFAWLYGRANGNWQVVLALLLVHSVLWVSQWELTYCLACPSWFLYKPEFRQVDALLATCVTLVSCLAYSALKMEVTCSTETLGDFQHITRHHTNCGNTILQNIWCMYEFN